MVWKSINEHPVKYQGKFISILYAQNEFILNVVSS